MKWNVDSFSSCNSLHTIYYVNLLLYHRWINEYVLVVMVMVVMIEFSEDQLVSLTNTNHKIAVCT